jgi:hypothetical protein
VFGTREKHEREIDAREREERVTTSPVWNRKETTKRDQILVGPALLWFSPTCEEMSPTKHDSNFTKQYYKSILFLLNQPILQSYSISLISFSLLMLSLTSFSLSPLYSRFCKTLKTLLNVDMTL